MPLTPPSPPPTPSANQYVQNTTVSFGQSRKAIKAYHASLRRENATLSDENKENVPPEDDKSKNPEPDVKEEEG